MIRRSFSFSSSPFSSPLSSLSTKMPSTLKDRFQQATVHEYVYNTSASASIPSTAVWQQATNATTLGDCATACSVASACCLEYEWDAMVKNKQCTNDYTCKLLMNATDYGGNCTSSFVHTELLNNAELSDDAWFGPMPSAGSIDGTCGNDTHGVREANNEYCPAKHEAELDLSSFQYESFYASVRHTYCSMDMYLDCRLFG